MFKTLPPGLVIILFLFLGFKTSSLSSFEKAEEIYFNGLIKGEYSNWPKADSIFLSLSEGNKFESVNQEIQAGLYRLHIRNTSPEYKTNETKQNEDLAFIEALLQKNAGLATLETDFHVQLQLLKNRIGLYRRTPESLKTLKELIRRYSSDSSVKKTTLAAVYETISQHFYAQKDNHKTTYYGRKSLELYLNSPWEFKKITMRQWVGGSYYNLDKIDSSLYFMKEAYHMLRKMQGDNLSIQKRRSQLAFNLGAIYQGKTGDYHESEHYLKEAIEWEIKANKENSPTLITYYSLLADTYYFIKDIEKAKFYGLKAYSLAHDILKIEDVYLKSLPSMSLSRIYVQNGDFENARKLIDRVLEESLAFFGKDDKFTTQVFIDKAYVEQKAGKLLEAEKYYLEAVESAEATGRIYSIQSAYTGLISMYTESGNYREALNYALLSWDLSSKNLHHDYKVKAFETLQLAKIYLGLEELKEAKQYLKQAEEILATNINTQLLDTEALSVKNSILFKEYQLTQNVEFLENAHSNIQKLIAIIIKGKSDYNYQNSKLYYSQSIAHHIENSMEIAAEMYKISPGEKEIDVLFKLMEINKSTVLLDGMMDTKVKTEKGVPKEILDDEKKLNQQLAALNREIVQAEHDSLVSKDDMERMLDERIQLNHDMERIQNYLLIKHPNYYEAKNLLLSENINYYQKNSLKSDQAFLEYYMGKDKIYRLLITKSGTYFDVLKNLNVVEEVSGRFIRDLLEMNSIEKSSAELANILLPQFPENINDLIIISDKKITQIPFEVLQDSQGMLLEKMNVSYAGSVQLYNVQKRLATNKRASVLWTGFAPDYAINRLPNNQKEVNEIGKLTDGKKINGTAATKSKFLEEAPKASVLHLATHSEIDKINPMLSKMYFYDGAEESGELTASEVYNLDLKADLVVLSACNTGLGKNESGDGVMSMSRAFTYAGVSSTVMSLWQVSDKETSELMVMFYENLEKRQSKNEALRNAKLNYLKNVKEPELRHPYYWAGFVISGDVTPIYGNSYWWLYLAGFVVLSGITLWFRKSRVSRATP